MCISNGDNSVPAVIGSPLEMVNTLLVLPEYKFVSATKFEKLGNRNAGKKVGYIGKGK